MSCVSYYHTHMYVFIFIMSILLQISWPTDLSSSETVVHCFHTLELKIAVRPVRSEPFHGKGCDFHGSITRNSAWKRECARTVAYFLLYQKRIHDLKSQYHISIILQHFRKILRRDDVKPGFGKWLQFGRNLYRNDMWWWRPWMQILACQKHVESRSSKELISIPSHFHSGNSQTVSHTSFNKLAPCKMSSIAAFTICWSATDKRKIPDKLQTREAWFRGDEV